jgi:glycosyltransferase involved in cell wall biosynthesis/ubiquinone/menaquinone biosynthesis C-methylase UbiE
LKFVIEALGLTVAGGKELALDLMTSLAGHPEHDFIFIVPDLSDYRLISGHHLRTTVCEKGSGLLQRAHLLNYEVPRICREERADALLCLGNFPSRSPGCPTAVLLQNAWMVYRDPVAESRRRLREKLITAYGRHLYRHLPDDITIITQTQVMKDHLCGQYGIDSRRVGIIPNTFSLARPGGNGEHASSGGNRGGMPFTFLCLAHYYAHKNIDILVDATRKLPRYTGRPAKCVITVSPEQHPGARRLLGQLARGQVAGKIDNIGPVPSEILPDVYRSAEALIFPTLLESFSRTYLEAMYFGLPILTSDRDFAHHLCRDAATYFDPLDADSVARAMARVMEDADLRQGLVENGQRLLAQAPTWQEIATRFVDVLERTARGDAGRGGPLRQGFPSLRGYARVARRGKESMGAPAASDVRALFNHKAQSWHCKYGPNRKLNPRVEQFTVRLSEFCLPPCNILDLGCGTGQIAAAMGQMGYTVTACDFAEEMIAIGRRHHVGSSVKWVCLEPDWELLPFADGSFDAIVASSVFEYLADVPRVVAELARVIRPGGRLLLSVPNPFNLVRKLEACFPSTLVRHRLPLLHRVQPINSYTSYLRLSRNRFRGDRWESLLTAAGFVALDTYDFSRDAWRNQATAPLILVAVKRVARAAECQLAGAAEPDLGRTYRRATI